MSSDCHGGPSATSVVAHGRPDTERWCLVGTPNVGKTSLINAITGARLQIGNWAGTTVEVASARVHLAGRELTLIDLPGAYALAGTAHEEALVLSALEATPDALIVNVVDANHLARDLSLTLELTELDRPMLVVVNLVEQAEASGLAVDADALEAALGVRVVALRDHRRFGADAVLLAAAGAQRPAVQVTTYAAPIEAAAAALLRDAPTRWHALAWLNDEQSAPKHQHAALAEAQGGLAALGVDPFLSIAESRHQRAHALASAALRHRGQRRDPTERVDRWLLHPLVGPLALIAGLALTFHLTFVLSDPWVGYFGVVQDVAAGWVSALAPAPLLASFLTGALIEGVGTVLAFVPVLFVLYVLLGVLENAGILARVAYLADGLMRAIGLPGRAVLPMVLAVGCTVPAIQTTRTLDARSDRLRVALALPSIACGARLPVFVLLAAAFVPGIAALVVTGLYVLGFVVAVLSAALFRRIVRTADSVGAMELPSYRWPPVRLVAQLAWARTRSFLRSAGGPILIAVVAVWALLEVQLPTGVSLFEFVARGVTPLFAPLGFDDWRVVGALIPATIAKEVAIGSLALTFVGADVTEPLSFAAGVGMLGIGLLQAATDTVTGLWGFGAGEAIDGILGSRLEGVMSAGSGVALMVFVLLYVPCIATLAALRAAFGTRWMLFSAAYQLTVAYLAAALVVLLWP